MLLLFYCHCLSFWVQDMQKNDSQQLTPDLGNGKEKKTKHNAKKKNNDKRNRQTNDKKMAKNDPKKVTKYTTK